MNCSALEHGTLERPTESLLRINSSREEVAIGEKRTPTKGLVILLHGETSYYTTDKYFCDTQVGYIRLQLQTNGLDRQIWHYTRTPNDREKTGEEHKQYFAAICVEELL